MILFCNFFFEIIRSTSDFNSLVDYIQANFNIFIHISSHLSACLTFTITFIDEYVRFAQNKVFLHFQVEFEHVPVQLNDVIVYTTEVYSRYRLNIL